MNRVGAFALDILRDLRTILPPLHRPCWRVAAIVLAGLGAVHLGATWGHDGYLREPRLSAVAVWPGMPMSEAWHYLIALAFHVSWQHFAYNAILFALAYPAAARAHGTWRPLLLAYLAAPIVVLGLDLAAVRPLAAAGVDYAEAAYEGRLVGFSVCAYAVLGLALASARPPLRWVAIAGWVIGDGIAAVVSNGTRPFVFAYHMAGLFLGLWFGHLHLTEPTATRYPGHPDERAHPDT